MNRFGLFLLVLLSCGQHAPPWQMQENVGLLNSKDGKVCWLSQNPGMHPGVTVRIVNVSPPQSVGSSRVEARDVERKRAEGVRGQAARRPLELELGLDERGAGRVGSNYSCRMTAAPPSDCVLPRKNGVTEICPAAGSATFSDR